MTVTRGVPQGSCLSPLLFNIFVRELPQWSAPAEVHGELKRISDTFQFADDITHSHVDPSLEVISDELVACFDRTKQFCDSHQLVINAAKTQLIILKSPRRRLPEDYRLEVGGVAIEPAKNVQLLGFTIDHHLTFGDHINKTVKECNGILGVLSRAAKYLPRELLKLAYIALIRSRLEYGSAVINSAAKTHLHKLDIVQKKASRIICHAPRDARSDPLLEALNLRPLQERRDEHILKLVSSILSKEIHPALQTMIEVGAGGRLKEDVYRTVAAGRSFRATATRLYNNRIVDVMPMAAVP